MQGYRIDRVFSMSSLRPERLPFRLFVMLKKEGLGASSGRRETWNFRFEGRSGCFLCMTVGHMWRPCVVADPPVFNNLWLASNLEWK